MRSEVMVKQARQCKYFIILRSLNIYICLFKFTVTCEACRNTIDTEVDELFIELQATSHDKVGNTKN